MTGIQVIFVFLEQVVTSYMNEGFSFLLQAFNVPKYLEDLTGLTKLMQDTRVDEVKYINSANNIHRVFSSFVSSSNFSFRFLKGLGTKWRWNTGGLILSKVHVISLFPTRINHVMSYPTRVNHVIPYPTCVNHVIPYPTCVISRDTISNMRHIMWQVPESLKGRAIFGIIRNPNRH
jgi:hypothetical protein